MGAPAIDIAKLTPDERLRLIDELWESLRATPEAVRLTPQQKESWIAGSTSSTAATSRSCRGTKSGAGSEPTWSDQGLVSASGSRGRPRRGSLVRGRAPGLGGAFASAVERAVDHALSFPEAYPVVHRDARRYLIERFPYCLYFRAEGDGVIVVALLHASRDPETHRGRLHE